MAGQDATGQDNVPTLPDESLVADYGKLDDASVAPTACHSADDRVPEAGNQLGGSNVLVHEVEPSVSLVAAAERLFDTASTNAASDSVSDEVDHIERIFDEPDQDLVEPLDFRPPPLSEDDFFSMAGHHENPNPVDDDDGWTDL